MTTTKAPAPGDARPAPAARKGPRRRAQLDTALAMETRTGPVAMLLKAVLYVLVVFVFAAPLVALLVGSISRVTDPTALSLIPNGFTWENFVAAERRNVYRYLFNSFVVVGGGLLLQMIVSVFAAYALARRKFRGQTIVLLAILTTMMLPGEVIAIPLSVVLADLPLLNINLIGTYAGMILPVVGWAFSILVMVEFMKEVPIELEEAARIDGAGELRIFWTVILPLCKPALGVIGVFGFTMIWDEYVIPLIVAKEAADFTLPIALRTLRADEEVGIGVLLAASILALLPSIIAFFAFQRQFMRGLTSGAIKG